MRIGVLTASGGTGHQLAAQTPDRGHSVLAPARDPGKVNLSGSADLTVVTADVLRGDMTTLSAGVDAVVSRIGIRMGDPSGTLVGAGRRGARPAGMARRRRLRRAGRAALQETGPAINPQDITQRVSTRTGETS